MALDPFFCYYGGKWRAAKSYPNPRYRTVIEPFAGAAGYSLRYSHLNIRLYDKDPIIFGIWDYLTKVTAKEILSLPSMVDHVDCVNAAQEAKWLIGFWLNKGSSTPKKTASKWVRSRKTLVWGEAVRGRIASQLDFVRHWKVFNDSYENAPEIDATWFIDPPYQGKYGRHYRCKINDYQPLCDWCKSRTGQVIVCERQGANWLPFRPFGLLQSARGSGLGYSPEAIWTNDSSDPASLF